ncbi:MAG: ATP synthase F1 subunit gamma [Acidobacteria bacterium]|nr:ATP synthase F1 subunit gamma [Acidobacteriota bacterium]
MAGGLIDIRRRIKSVKNTQQITKAMKMVAASRLRRSQDRVIAARPYAETLAQVLGSVASRVGAGEDGAPAHPLLATREEKHILVVTVTTDKGLCGAFNTNVNRTTSLFVKNALASGKKVSLVCLGKKGYDFWKRRDVPILDSRPGIFSKFDSGTAREIAQGLAKRFLDGEVDSVYALSNDFKSVIAQITMTRKLLPVALEDLGAGGKSAGQDYLYEPGPEVLLGMLVPQYLEFQLFRILLESAAAEHAARMTAMEGASKNAGEMIRSLTLIYNRARQARITKELIEIVSGAAALD